MYGFSPPVRLNGAAIRSAAAFIELSETFTAVDCFTYSAAQTPALLPKTNQSESVFPPNLFEPCMPPATSPAANKPGTPTAAAVSASTSTPPIT